MTSSDLPGRRPTTLALSSALLHLVQDGKGGSSSGEVGGGGGGCRLLVVEVGWILPGKGRGLARSIQAGDQIQRRLLPTVTLDAGVPGAAATGVRPVCTPTIHPVVRR